jgi:hypothetical protein
VLPTAIQVLRPAADTRRVTSERGRLGRIKAVLTMDERDASALVWERFISLANRHPWRVRFLIVLVAAPFLLLEWFVLEWKVVALAYAAVTVGLLVSLRGIASRHSDPGG